MDEETVILQASNPKCPVCGKQVDLVEAQAEGVEDEWRCGDGHWSKVKRLVELE
ncbi:hypothetical protein [Halolamina salina]|uniref:Uncharacterized protein n=1 Tax=Halolamina salina TaxID=1220023 RepID=A0ABD6B3N4_9EURY